MRFRDAIVEALSVPASASALALRLRRRKVDTLAALRELEAAGSVRFQGTGRSSRWHGLSVKPDAAPVVVAPLEEPQKQKGETVSAVQPLALAAGPIPDSGAARRERAQAALELAAAEASEGERARRRREREQEDARQQQLAADHEWSLRAVETLMRNRRGGGGGAWAPFPGWR